MSDSTEDLLLRRVLVDYAAQYQPTAMAAVAQAGFSGARIWKVTAPAGTFALRQWPAAGLERERLLGLHQLLQHLSRHGVAHVAPPVADRNGATLVGFADRLWQLEPWLPGEASYHAAPTDAKLTAALRALAAWHRAAATFQPAEAHRRWFFALPSAPSPGLAERLQMIADWNSRRLDAATESVQSLAWREFRDVALPTLSLFRDRARRMGDELRMALDVRFRLQPCLRDVWHDHLLFVGEEVTGIIDPSTCRSETVAADIARLVGSLVGDDRSGWETAVAAYQAVNPLSLDERAAIELFDRSGVLLSGLTWVQRIACDRQPVADPNRVLARMRAILARMQTLGN